MPGIRWRAIENNPEVLTTLAQKFGLVDSLGFYDVFSLDDAELLAFIPRPALALVLVFPVGDGFEKLRSEHDAALSLSNGVDEKGAVWYKQTIGNACGTMAILHAVSNNESKIKPDSEFAELLRDLKKQNTSERIETIEQSKLIDSAHQEVAVQGQSSVIPAEENVELHFVAFVKSEVDAHFYEFDGSRKGPIDHGHFTDEEDVLSEKALDIVKQFIKGATDDDNLNFSLCALAPA